MMNKDKEKEKRKNHLNGLKKRQKMATLTRFLLLAVGIYMVPVLKKIIRLP